MGGGDGGGGGGGLIQWCRVMELSVTAQPHLKGALITHK